MAAFAEIFWPPFACNFDLPAHNGFEKSKTEDWCLKIDARKFKNRSRENEKLHQHRDRGSVSLFSAIQRQLLLFKKPRRNCAAVDRLNRINNVDGI
ncbi:MAG: hypothetical protein WAL75_02675 [Terracidiphilus sp.]